MNGGNPSMAGLREAETPIGAADLAAIAQMVHAHAGICLDRSKAMLVYSRLSRRLRLIGAASFSDYVEIIRNDAAERAAAIEALTTNHTKFFREIHHFDHFAAAVRPGLVERLRKGERVRIWSSAASSGEEIYSLAMCLLGTDPAEARRIAAGDVALLATDLSEEVLRVGRTGLYPLAQRADIPPAYAERWTTVRGGSFEIAGLARDLVRFRKLNLLNAWPMRGRFDLILCRNVMIYFDEATKARLLSRLVDQLCPGGILYIGHSERLVGPSADQLVSIGQTSYRKVEA